MVSPPGGCRATRSALLLIDVTAPAAERRDVLGAGRGMGFAEEPAHLLAVLELDRADAERRRDAVDEAPDRLGRERPHLDVDRMATRIGAQEARPGRRKSVQG